jgi:hypothetical protein
LTCDDILDRHNIILPFVWDKRYIAKTAKN